MSSMPCTISPITTSISDPDRSHHLPNGRGFANPWPSWTKPSLLDWWSGLHWQPKGLLAPAAAQAGLLNDEDEDRDVIIPSVTRPDFACPPSTEKCVRAWWLGHAGVLLEVPRSSPSSNREPLRILFDPIFSNRCSPSQYWGPIRFVPPPCRVTDLPRIDMVIISHNHYDHLDAETITELWKGNREHLRFVVPMGNREWFRGIVGNEMALERVTELDWWEEVSIRSRGVTKDDEEDEDLSISSALEEGDIEARIVCTPAQHGSGRYGLDAGSSLWASYTLFFSRRGNASASQPEEKPFRVFFGGDTGYKLRPPATQSGQGVRLHGGEGEGDSSGESASSASSAATSTVHPACPAFREIQENLLGSDGGVSSSSADLLLLPISVGSTYSYVRSWDPVGFLPTVDGGLTAANHLDTWEACEVAHVLLGPDVRGKEARGESKRPTVLGMHFATFSPEDETRDTVKRLGRACRAWDWRYKPRLQAMTTKGDEIDDEEHGEPKDGEANTRGDFVILDHGGSLEVSW
ncbi:Metallo-hydrolase/oxidoreductase [Jaminaea rosea]|uniref:Metallo-hydrolase/oxidoreductase n=1 Tax=Jaminaea rosea TaxID=1569628 RepID=A0A316V0E3_9BASI|nr:Metallo-hydrolase/oxidoreductase [Jaminaea rosea]PWN30468.1 Metallo-hydrolase/oxidoreductase [Jaminaea rosea]